jgi:hypothetical protein
MLALVLVAILLSRGMRETTSERGDEHSPGPPAVATSEGVSLVVDFGDGRSQQHESIAWREGMTVRDALAAAADSTGGVEFAQRGSGESALLTRMAGVENEGAGGRNWTYSVNGQPGDRSFAIYPLRPGDRVLWTFAAEQ